MMVVVSYDIETKNIAGRRRLRHIAKICQDYGQRVQNSIFECVVDPDQWKKLQLTLLDEYDPSRDSLRFYFLGSNYKRRIECHGAKQPQDLTNTLIL